MQFTCDWASAVVVDSPLQSEAGGSGGQDVERRRRRHHPDRHLVVQLVFSVNVLDVARVVALVGDADGADGEAVVRCDLQVGRVGAAQNAALHLPRLLRRRQTHAHAVQHQRLVQTHHVLA